jgi:hypothetical protein
MREVTAHKLVWWGWGGLDALFILNYVVKSALRGNLPFYSDVMSTLKLMDDHGDYVLVLAALFWVGQLSIIASCVLLLCRSAWGRRLVWVQLPFRLLLFVPSASVLFSYVGFHSGSIMLFMLVLLSELAKVWSLWFFRESPHTTEQAPVLR